MSRSPSLKALNQRLFKAAGLAMLSTLPLAASALALTPQTNAATGVAIRQASNTHQWLMADKDDRDDRDDRDEKKGRDDDRGERRDRDNDRAVRIDLNRAKNLARQAAEAANGGIRYYSVRPLRLQMVVFAITVLKTQCMAPPPNAPTWIMGIPGQIGRASCRERV